MKEAVICYSFINKKIKAGARFDILKALSAKVILKAILTVNGKRFQNGWNPRQIAILLKPKYKSSSFNF
ncbi:MAG: hypothetical protein IPL97_11045 [Niastella sp.]|nr:hypothetical protein [Niastella sp.]